MTMCRDIRGVILAGGRSSRFGTNKAFAHVGGHQMIEHALREMNALFKNVMIVTNTPNVYAHLPASIVRDETPHLGPLGGITTALKHADIFVVACDMPFITRVGIETVLSKSNGHNAVVARRTTGRLEPLFALYRRALLPVFRSALNRGELSITRFILDMENVHFVDIDAHVVTNINTTEDAHAFV